eukprot:TRINITY_DN47746_c0_g1_i1.p1 TRINITY_DN47746_c0_g1~~TRINITY_DN47746_c0_g1_i1.p1  ORF type:complete len:346 (-),score=100.67 TRINITY_DN47746_c0_g1_i1:85-1122(-)
MPPVSQAPPATGFGGFLHALLVRLKCPVRKEPHVSESKPREMGRRPLTKEALDMHLKTTIPAGRAAAPSPAPALTMENLAKHEGRDVLNSYINGPDKKQEEKKAVGAAPAAGDDDSSSDASGVTALTMTRMQQHFGGQTTSSAVGSKDQPLSAEAIARNYEAKSKKKEKTKKNDDSDEDGSGVEDLGSHTKAKPEKAKKKTPVAPPPAEQRQLSMSKFSSEPLSAARQRPNEVRIRRLGAAEGVTATVDYETMKQAIKEMKREFKLKAGSKGSAPPATDPALYLATKLAPGARLNASKFMSSPTRPMSRTSIPPAVKGASTDDKPKAEKPPVDMSTLLKGLDDED